VFIASPEARDCNPLAKRLRTHQWFRTDDVSFDRLPTWAVRRDKVRAGTARKASLGQALRAARLSLASGLSSSADRNRPHPDPKSSKPTTI
ncbi:MAG TPA: hypothetical protein VIS57_06085, partial [Xanthomonadales bacterium]